jgi:hypothetical protein
MTVTHLKKPRLSLAGLASLLLVVFASCGDDEMKPEDPKVTGEWTGQVPINPLQASVTLMLTEDDAGAVTGTLTFSVAGQGGSGPVTGTHNYPDVSLNLQIEVLGRPLTGKYAGRLATEDRMEGTFSTDDGTISGVESGSGPSPGYGNTRTGLSSRPS